MGWSVSGASYSGAGKTGLLSQSKEPISLDQNSNKLFQMPKLLSITIPYHTLYIKEDNYTTACTDTSEHDVSSAQPDIQGRC